MKIKAIIIMTLPGFLFNSFTYERNLADNNNKLWYKYPAMGNWDKAIITEMHTGQGFENGFTFQHSDYHWERKDLFKEGNSYCHFQLDGSAAVPRCIAEMLTQSHTDEIHLLPALPDELKTGKKTGLKARGGYKINMEWKKGELIWAEIYADRESPIPVPRLKDKIIDPADSKIIELRRRNN